MNAINSISYVELQRLIQEGKTSQVLSLLRIRKNRLALIPNQRAELYRRTGQYNQALLELKNELFIRQELKKNLKDATLLEYALNLAQLGLLSQAEFFMNHCHSRPFAWFQLQGFIALEKLEYETAVQAFRSARESAGISNYQGFVSEVNIANALLGTFQFKEAIVQSKKTLNSLDPEEHRLLIRHLHHICAQAFAFLGQQGEFRASEKNVFGVIPEEPTLNTLVTDFEFYRGRFVAECVLGISHSIPLSALLHAVEEIGSDHARLELLVMDRFHEPCPILLYTALANCSGKFLQKRFELLKGKSFGISGSHLEFVLGESIGSTVMLDLGAGSLMIKPGQLPHKILSLFIKNSFKSYSINDVYQSVFPDRIYFNPVHSPNLIHQAIRRLNRLLTLEGIPLEVKSKRRRYFLNIRKSIQVRVLLESQARSFFRDFCESIFGHTPFATEDLARKLRLTPRQSRNLIRQNAQELTKVKEGRRVRYSIKVKDRNALLT